MQNYKSLKVIGIIILILLVLLVAFAATGLVSTPRAVQRIVFSVWFKVTRAESNSEKMVEYHIAPKIKVVDDKGKVSYTYKYTNENRHLIERESAICEACHGTMRSDDPKNIVHKSMFDAPMLNFNCTDCHKKVDLAKRSPGRATIQVDRTSCLPCHDALGSQSTAEETGGQTWGTKKAPKMPSSMKLHGNDAVSGKQWILQHPRLAMGLGINDCRSCHLKGSELDFCNECHMRGGSMPSSHRAVYSVRLNELFPKITQKTNKVKARWLGYHFVFVKKALKKINVTVNSSEKLPLDKLQKLSCGACHDIKGWCNRCHTPHTSNWLDPVKGHPASILKHGKKHCSKCHDYLGEKCTSCHESRGELH
ncbi:MAG: hypothetical protein C4562_00365 [Actinobacteria bacterium]|nr:MAG: hypothetical protein C4562_00365 [Actinomycetota bacterium]